MKILISGAGVAGLALAAFLKKHDITAHIVDRSPNFKHLGFAIVMWPIGTRILNKLQAPEHIFKKNFPVKKMIVSDSLGNVIETQDLKWVREGYGDVFTIHREDLHAGLRELVDIESISFGTTVEKIQQQKDSVQVKFNNGESGEYDLVVSGDGVGSKIREMVFGVGAELYNFSVWFSWLKRNPKLPKSMRIIMGKGAYILFLPSTGGRDVAYFFVSTKPGQPDSETQNIESLAQAFSGFKSTGAEIFNSVDEEPTHIFHDRVRKVRLHNWYQNRVVLMGDAEHATTPLTGMGSSLALEDAFVLYDELLATSFDSKSVSIALRRYAERRQPRVLEAERFSDALVALATSSTIVESIRNKVLKTRLASELLRGGIKLVMEHAV